MVNIFVTEFTENILKNSIVFEFLFILFNGFNQLNSLNKLAQLNNKPQ